MAAVPIAAGGRVAMIVGAAMVELHVHGSRSLKQRRGVVNSIKQRVRNRFNLSVAEVGGQDTWQRVVLGLSAAGGEAARVRQVLDDAVRYIESLHLAEVLGSEIAMLGLDEMERQTEADFEPLPWDPEGED